MLTMRAALAHGFANDEYAEYKTRTSEIPIIHGRYGFSDASATEPPTPKTPTIAAVSTGIIQQTLESVEARAPRMPSVEVAAGRALRMVESKRGSNHRRRRHAGDPVSIVIHSARQSELFHA